MKYLSPIAFIIGSICWIVINLKAKSYQSAFAWICVLCFSIKELAERSEL